MSPTSVEADGSAGALVALATVDGTDLLTFVGPDRVVRVAPGLIGTDGTGPYFDPAGALIGEQAVLGYDAAAGGRWFAEAQSDPVVHGLMLRRPTVAQRVVAAVTPQGAFRRLVAARRKRERARAAARTLSGGDWPGHAAPIAPTARSVFDATPSLAGAQHERSDARGHTRTLTIDRDSQGHRDEARGHVLTVTPGPWQGHPAPAPTTARTAADLGPDLAEARAGRDLARHDTATLPVNHASREQRDAVRHPATLDQPAAAHTTRDAVRSPVTGSTDLAAQAARSAARQPTSVAGITELIEAQAARREAS